MVQGLEVDAEQARRLHLLAARLLEHARDVEPLLRESELRIAVDVTNPLLGPTGATAIYGPQKGVTAVLAPALDQALGRWAECLRSDLGLDLATLEGAGAGGGLPVGLLAVTRAAGGRASIESGAALVAAAIGLRDAIAESDLVVTGEGRLDAQTAFGKAVGYVAQLAREAGKPCVAVAGAIEGLPDGIVDVESLSDEHPTTADAMLHAAELATAAAARLITRRVASM